MIGVRHESRARAGWAVGATMTLLAAVLGMPAALAADDQKYFEVYGFAQLDYIQDFDRVDPNWTDTLRPSKIPTTEGLFGANGQAILSVRQSRLGVQANFPTSKGAVYTKFEFDMFGTGGDEGKTTIRLRYAYGQWGQFLAGQTTSLFMDLSIFPNVVDYWGPAGMVFLRDPQIRWTPFSGANSFAIAIEKPSNDIDTGQVRTLDPELAAGIQPSQRIPDFTAQYRMQHDWGHIQVAGILRQVSFDTVDTPNNEPKDSQLGWGLDLTSAIKVAKKDQVLLGVVYGHGIASYMNDGGTDMAPGGTVANPDAQTVPLLGVSAYYDRYWSDRFSSSFGYSQTHVDNTSLQTADAFTSGQYASANFLYYPVENFFVGIEGLWGERKDNGDATGTDRRVQISFHYNFSSKHFFKQD
jgi:hypothetical protein